jgi:hypothetical protein
MMKVLVVVLLLIIAVLLLGIRVFFAKNGKFPNTHVGGNKAMREKGIGCVSSQDKEAQKDTKRLNTSDIVKQIIEDN